MLRAGIVGLPNAGKSTLFNAVTRTRNARRRTIPFCTIDPNVGTVTVPDPRLAELQRRSPRPRRSSRRRSSSSTSPASVKGASQGEGLGNKFLTHIREVDAIIQVVRCFESEDMHHVTGSVDPVRDIEVSNTELHPRRPRVGEKRAERQQKASRSGDKVAKAEAALCELLPPHPHSGKPALTIQLNDEDKKLSAGFFSSWFRSSCIPACNVGENDLATSTQDTVCFQAREGCARVR